MKNVIVANYRESKTNSVKQYSLEKLTTDLKCQIQNSIECGWKLIDIYCITNFEFEYYGVKGLTHLVNLNKNCLTGSKMFVLKEFSKHTNNIWIHDLDCWQCEKFESPLKDCNIIGLSEYSLPKFNGGSVFFDNSNSKHNLEKSQEMLNEICSELENENREEPTLDKLLRGKYKEYTQVLNSTWNLGCSAYKVRYERAEKPIKAVHFHPSNRLAWSTHTRNSNKISKDAVIPDRLKSLFMRYYYKDIVSYKYEDGLGPLEINE